MAIVIDVNVQIFDDLRSNPTGADFVAGERCLVHDDDVEARSTELPCARRPCWTTTADQNIAGIQTQLARVNGAAAVWPRSNNTWNSCSEPVENDACDPVRYNRQARTNCSSNMESTCRLAFSKRNRQCSNVLA